MPDAAAMEKEKKRLGKYRRARIRSMLFTVGPSRLTGGRIIAKHIARGVVIREVEAQSPNWPRAFDGLRIGHVSDFHLGELMPVDRAIGVVDQLAQCDVDLIACTGDVVDLHHAGVDRLLDALANADSTMGTALVLGNHDELHDGPKLARKARNAGVMVLQDEALRISRGEDTLVVSGIGWARSATLCEKAIERTCGDETHILLSHNPKAFPSAAKRGIAMTLAGHTHGGQVALKNRRGANLSLTHRYTAGLYCEEDSCLYVTSGVGSWFPLRVNCPPEIAVITMHHRDPPSAEERRRNERKPTFPFRRRAGQKRPRKL